MSSQSPEPPQPDKPSESNGGSSASSLAPVVPQVEQKLEAFAKDLPENKQEEFKHTIHEVFAMFMERSGGPRIDSETAKILAASADKDNDLRFRYLSQKQKDTADQKERDQKLEERRLTYLVRFIWPILIAVLIVAIGGISAGIYFASTGREMLGSNLLTGFITAILAFIGGMGCPRIFKLK